MKRIFLLFIALITTLTLAQSALADYPKPVGFVNDFANVLSPNFKRTEEQKLSNYQKKTTNEITVVTIDTTGNMVIDDYAQGLADQWKPGVSDKDNGIIILFAMQDHHDRIQTGCGLEGALSDIDAQAILDGDTRSLMREGEIDQAIGTTVDQVIAKIGNATPQPCKVGSQQAINNARGSTAPDNTGSKSNGGLLQLLIILAIIAIVIIVIIMVSTFNSDDSNDDSNDDSPRGGFGTGALLGGALGYGLGRSSRSSKDNDDDDSSSSNSSWFGGSSSPSSDNEESSSSGFGGFSGGSYSGGGASSSW